MKVEELNREQLTELKGNYCVELVNEGNFTGITGLDLSEPSYEFLDRINDYIPDNVIFSHYNGIVFSIDDFLCSTLT